MEIITVLLLALCATIFIEIFEKDDEELNINMYLINDQKKNYK